jgi:hypothetical protein
MKALLYFVVLFLFASYICLPLMDPDLWWHIVIGRWILANKTVPDQDYWTIFAFGKPWMAYSWSNEVLYAVIEKYFDLKGLLTLKLGLCFALALSSAIGLSLIAKDWFFGIICTAIILAGTSQYLTLRPQLLIWTILPLFIACLEKLRSENFSLKTLLVLMGLTTIWANSHITTIFALITCIVWLWGNRILWTVLPAFLFASLLTPYYGSEWLTFIQKSSHPLNFQAIAEFQTASILDFSTCFLLIMLFLLNLFIFNAKKQNYFLPVIYALVMFVVALAVNKFTPFALIIMSAVMALYWQELGLRKELNLVQALRNLQLLISKLPVQGLTFVCLALAVVNVNKLYQNFYDPAHVPKATYDFFKEKQLPYPILNDFGRGGYVMYRESDPDGNVVNRVSIDGRTNVTPYDIWLKFNASFYGKNNWRDYIDSVKPKSIIWSNASPFVNLLIASGEWCQVFQQGSADSGFSLFLNKEDFLKLGTLKSDNCLS